MFMQNWLNNKNRSIENFIDDTTKNIQKTEKTII